MLEREAGQYTGLAARITDQLSSHSDADSGDDSGDDDSSDEGGGGEVDGGDMQTVDRPSRRRKEDEKGEIAGN